MGRTLISAVEDLVLLHLELGVGEDTLLLECAKLLSWASLLSMSLLWPGGASSVGADAGGASAGGAAA